MDRQTVTFYFASNQIFKDLRFNPRSCEGESKAGLESRSDKITTSVTSSRNFGNLKELFRWRLSGLQ
jgi:hypothetical protein